MEELSRVELIESEELREGHSRLNDIQVHLKRGLKGAPITIAHCDTDLRYMWIHNPHPNFNVEQCIGKRDDELGQCNGIIELIKLKSEVLSTGKCKRKEISFVLPDEIKIYDVSAEPLYNLQGDVNGVVTVSTDITIYKEMEKELFQIKCFKLMGQIAEGLSDSMRNPMTTIIGFLQLIKKKSFIDGYIRELLIDELENLNSIIHYLALLSNNKAVNKENLNLNDIIDDFLYDFLIKDDNKGCILEKKLDSDIQSIRIDKEEISLLLKIIIQNCIETFDEIDKGIVMISTVNNEDCIELIIRDNGKGVSQEHLERIYEPFYTTKDHHLGLGLSIAYSILIRNGGKPEIISDENGTTFRVLFKK